MSEIYGWTTMAAKQIVVASIVVLGTLQLSLAQDAEAFLECPNDQVNPDGTCKDGVGRSPSQGGGMDQYSQELCVSLCSSVYTGCAAQNRNNEQLLGSCNLQMTYCLKSCGN